MSTLTLALHLKVEQPREKDINSSGKSNSPYTPFRLPKRIRGKV